MAFTRSQRRKDKQKQSCEKKRDFPPFSCVFIALDYRNGRHSALNLHRIFPFLTNCTLIRVMWSDCRVWRANAIDMKCKRKRILGGQNWVWKNDKNLFFNGKSFFFSSRSTELFISLSFAFRSRLSEEVQEAQTVRRIWKRLKAVLITWGWWLISHYW